MISQLFLIIVSAAVTSVLTLSLAWYLYQNHLKDRLLEQIEEKSEELGVELQDRVREGVREGIREGFSDLPTDLVGKATKRVTKTGMDVLEDSMNLWLGSSRSRSDK